VGVGDSYDAVAGDYAAQFLDELDRKPFDRELLDELASRLVGPVVDVGCGPGHIGARARATVGLDLSHEMLRLAPFPLRVRGDMQALPFASGSLGGAIAFYSLIHLEAIDVALRELRRAIRPGGVLALAVHEGVGGGSRDEWYGKAVDLWARFFTRDEIVEAVEAAGFAIESAIVRPPYDHELTTRVYVVAAVR
jgi:SAM-dependent methyltransferase